ncbi:MAG TPA: ribonuclease PH [Verrucomicrobiae bacterium]|nr:ribonuclease PH [Verrucomicrobiae bacterium]
MKRVDGRRPNELRPVKIHPNYVKQAAGSALIEMGETRVLCAASVEDGVPRWMREQGVKGGWITAEYSMLPYATAPRKPREVTRGRVEGRTQEIQRLVGRAMRSVTDMETLGERTVWIDCDVLQADGGTRTASITGAYVAVMLAMKKLMTDGELAGCPVTAAVAAISVGILEGEALLDLCYVEDSKAAVDMNVVMTDAGQFVEVQGTGEDAPFTQRQMNAMLKLAREGIEELMAIQKKVLE